MPLLARRLRTPSWSPDAERSLLCPLSVGPTFADRIPSVHAVLPHAFCLRKAMSEPKRPTVVTIGIDPSARHPRRLIQPDPSLISAYKGREGEDLCSCAPAARMVPMGVGGSCSTAETTEAFIGDELDKRGE